VSRKIIVVGGGILGTATAWQLARAGVDVTLLESGKFGHGASIGSFAWLNSNNKTPRAYHDLNVAGMEEYRRLSDELRDDTWLHWSGNVEWYSDAGGQVRLREKVARLQDWGYRARTFPIIELSLVDTELVAPEAVEEFAWYPDEGYIDPLPLIGRLLDEIRELGGAARDEVGAASLIIEHGRVTGAGTAAGERLTADLVVSCTGSATSEFVRLAGVDLPLIPTTGMVAISAPSPVNLRVVHHDDLMHIRPAGEGRVMMRHTDLDERVEPGTTVEQTLLDQLRDRVATVLPALAGVPVETARVRVRPIPADQQAVIGSAPGVDGLYVIVTHSGITLGPLLGRLAAEELVGGEPNSMLSSFRPDRFVV
jgi:glycine/D-amino acid oxidase-like deaminating enzyme